MQHILWSTLFTSNDSMHYHIHHKMDEQKLTIIRRDTPNGEAGTSLFVHT